LVYNYIMTITIYSTPVCVYCRKAKEFLKNNNVPYNEVNVVESQVTLDAFVAKTGQRSVPVIDVDGDVKIGYDENWLKGKLSMASVMSDPAEDTVCDSCQ